MENEYGILEVEVDKNGEIDKKYEDFIMQKCQEAIDEDIWYTEEVIESLDKLEEENNKCIESFIRKDQK